MILNLLLPLILTSHQADPDTLVDIFPLAVGNQWTYQYQTHSSFWTGEIYSDSGIVHYKVIERIDHQDSTQWTFQEFLIITSCTDYNLAQRPGGKRTCSPIVDSTIFQITEQHDTRHRMYRNQSTPHFWKSVFPWRANLTDTNAVYRYSRVDQSGISRLTAIDYPYPTGIYKFVFKQGQGLLNFQYSGVYLAGATAGTKHELINSVVTSVAMTNPQSEPTQIILKQNYPNPFNPTTVISFWLPYPTRTRLQIFNVLGQPIASLLDGTMSPGHHAIPWNASAFPSGTYFYRLETESGVHTLRAIILR